MATVPFVYECNKEAGFVMDPNEQKRIGYITALNGFKLAATLPADLQVSVPFNSGANPTFSGLQYTPKSDTIPVGVAKVVGVIEKFEWNGGIGDPIKLEFYVSQENATQIKALQQQSLQTTKVDALAWWLADYDQEVKKWFEQAYPIGGSITGIITGKENPELDVDLNPVPVKDGIDVNVYKVTMAVVPAANKQYTLHFANSDQKKVIKAWGLVVGTLAGTALPPG